jgi:hypothetical protein
VVSVTENALQEKMPILFALLEIVRLYVIRAGKIEMVMVPVKLKSRLRKKFVMGWMTMVTQPVIMEQAWFAV